jgi:hypothetical protein
VWPCSMTKAAKPRAQSIKASRPFLVFSGIDLLQTQESVSGFLL